MHILSRFRFIAIPFFLICVSLIPAISAYPADRSVDEPFTGPNNWGGTGLMEIPTGRVMKENTFRFGVGLMDPYLHYYAALSPLKGLELDLRVTEILGTKITTPGWEGYGNDKTKVVDLKYQILPEGKYLPALSLGIMDPHGTRQYASQYLAVSKQIYPFDFTLGFGNGRYGEKPLPSQGEGFKIEMFEEPKQWVKDSQVFWGIQYAATDNLLLMLEYNPIQYHKQTSDPAYDRYFREPVSSQYNLGFRYNLWDWAEIDLSYQRGDTFGVNISIPMEIGRPLIPIYDPPYKEPLSHHIRSLEYRLERALPSSGFGDVGVEIIGGRIVIYLQNSKYFYITRALDVLLSTIAPILRRYDIDDITILFREGSIPLCSVNMTKAEVVNYAKYRRTAYETYLLPKFNAGYIAIPPEFKRGSSQPTFGLKPQFNLLLNDPSRFWKWNLGVFLWASYSPWAGGTLSAGVGVYPFSGISSVVEPLSLAVRSDFVDYLKKKTVFERFLFNQLYRIPNSNIFSSFSAGFLEAQYAGLDGEIASAFWGGRIFLGLSGSVVKKRDPDNPFKLKADDVKSYYATAFIDTRLNFPGPDISLDIKYGKFLAGDVGVKFTLSKFIRGVEFSAWYSFTGTDIFNDDFNRGYHEKGIAVSIPIRLIKGSDSRAAYYHAISPWTRDVAQDIAHFRSLFSLIGRNVDIFFEKDMGAR